MLYTHTNIYKHTIAYTHTHMYTHILECIVQYGTLANTNSHYILYSLHLLLPPKLCSYAYTVGGIKQQLSIVNKILTPIPTRVEAVHREEFMTAHA